MNISVAKLWTMPSHTAAHRPPRRMSRRILLTIGSDAFVAVGGIRSSQSSFLRLVH